MGQKSAAGVSARGALRSLALMCALALVLSLVALVTRVEAIPTVGHTFYGTVKNTQGVSLPNGMAITAKAAGGPWTGAATTKVGPPDAGSGSYFVTVPGDDPNTAAIEGAVAGNPIAIYVGGTKAKLYDAAQGKWVDSYPWASGGATNLNLQADIYYTISASSGPGGTISPAGPVSVPLGGSKTFNITADAGFELADVVVDSASVGAVNPYTFNNVSANHTISAAFRSTVGSLGGFIFLDANGNGTREDSEIAGLLGVTMTLTLPSGGTQTTLTTGNDGAYEFGSLMPGAYTVVQTQPPGYVSTSPDSVTANVLAGQAAVVNFGEQMVTPTPSPTPVLGNQLYLPLVTR
jgi:hypothetical protein